jgi:putative transposase
MRRVHLGKGIRFKLHEKVYEIVKVHEESVQVEDVSFGGETSLTNEQIREHLYNDELHFEQLGKNTKVERGFRFSDYPDIDMLPQREKDELDFRLEAIRPLLSIKGNLQSNLVQRKKEIATPERTVSEASLRRWVDAMRDSQGDIRSLIPNFKSRGNHNKRIQTELDMIIDEAIDQKYKKREKIRVNTVLEAVILEANSRNKDKYRPPEDRLIFPSESTILRRIKEKDPYEMSKAKFGEKTAFDKFGIVNLQKKAKRPLERVQMDNTCLDFYVLDDDTYEPMGRPNCVISLDTATGYPLGFYIGFEPASYTTVMHGLKHSIQKKTYIKEKYPKVDNEWLAHGLPEVLSVDNGSDYISKDLQHACDLLGIYLHHCPVKKPWFKGQIERFFKTLNTNLLHELPGTTFSNILEKKVRDYDPEKHTLITFGKLIEIIHIWICDIYAQSYSKGVKGIPALLWEKAVKMYGDPALPPSALEWEIVLMKMRTASIQRSGIRYLNLFYQSVELGELRRKLEVKPKNQRFVDFKFDPTDMSKIFVFDEFENKYIKVLCVDMEYSKDLNLFTHKLVNQMAREEYSSVDVVARSKSREKIGVIVKEEGKKLKTFQRKTKARIKGVGTDKELSSKPPVSKPLEPKKKASKKSKRTEDAKVVALFRTEYEDDWTVKTNRKK